MSNLLKALAWIAPSAAVRRAHAFAALDSSRSYDGATRGRRGASFKSALGDSANGQIGPALAKLRERSSDLVRNTWIGARCLDVLTAHAVGTGINVAWKDSKVQELWDEWCKTADIEGERDFAGSQMVVFRSMLERGDAGVRFVTRKLDAGRAVPLALQVVEGDQIATEINDTREQKKSRLGVVLGEWNERLGYWLHKDHPGDYMTIASSVPTFVDRKDFCHLYRPLRAGQIRGVPVLSPVVMGTRDYADLMDAMIVKSRMEACYGLIVNSADPVKNLADAKTRDDQSGKKVESMSPGMIYRAGLGDTVTAFSPSGAGQFEPVALSALMGIASGGMITYDQLTGDLRQANYSSLRAGKIEFRRLIEQMQWLVIVPFLMNRVTERFIETAILAGKLRERKTPYRRSYVMPAIEPIDPLKDLKADILAVRSGRLSPQEFIGAWGRDWRKVTEEIKEFWDEADKAGLVLDIDPRRVDQAGSAQGDAGDDTPPTDDPPASAKNTKKRGISMRSLSRGVRSASRPNLTPDGFEPGALVNRAAGDDIMARFAASSYDSEARTVEAVFSAGTRISRWGVYEELAISPEAIDLSRVPLGQVRLLDTHNQSSLNAVLGVVESARIEGGKLVGKIRFADTAAGRNAEGMVARGELTGISVGYRVSTWSLTSTLNEVEIWRADKWELLEVSLVAVPADPQASTRSTPIIANRADAHSEETDDMRRNVAAPGDAPANITPAAPAADATRTAPAAPAADATRTAPAAPAADATRAAPAADANAAVIADRARATEITSIGTRSGMDSAAVQSAINEGTTVEVFRARAFDHMAAAADRTRTSNVQVGRDETQTRMEHMTDALTIRLGGRLVDSEGNARSISTEAREFSRHSLAEMAAVVLGERAMPRDAQQREDALRRAMHTTSDFPVIFESTINRVLASRYEAQVPTYRRISAQRNFRDFRPHSQLRVGDFPMLQKVNESGQIQFGTFGESKEVVAVAPYAVQFAISRRMLVDDNIGAIDQMLGSYGQTVAAFEENTFYAMKAVNSGLGPTLIEGGEAVFHAAKHGNYTASGTVINAAALGVGRAAMRKQKNQSGALINVSPKILLVGPDKETEADMAVAVITPTEAGNVNPFSKKLEVVTGPTAGNAWELYADPAALPVFVWGMLDGYGAPRLRIENPFGVQGVGVSLEHDFGCGAIDYRGGYRNAGA